MNAKEYEVKAALIVKLFEYIYWPDSQPITSNKEKPRLCIVGFPTYNSSLLLSENDALNERFDIVRDQSYRRCDVAFIPSVSTSELNDVLRELERSGNPVTISDSTGFAKAGVMINFVIENERIVFEINWSRMKERGFNISSRVLKLARIVHE